MDSNRRATYETNTVDPNPTWVTKGHGVGDVIEPPAYILPIFYYPVVREDIVSAHEGLHQYLGICLTHVRRHEASYNSFEIFRLD